MKPDKTGAVPDTGPLAGFRVLDLSRVLAGPYCTMLLGDLGADVIKVEQPGKGDDTRHWGPPFEAGASAYFLCCNRNKRSVTIDLSTAEGQALVRSLARCSDVLVENFLPGKLRRFGLDHETLCAENEKLVYCSITGFGQSGPRHMQPGYDILVQALSGIMSITGEPVGEPMKVGVAIADITAGLFASNAIMAALLARQSKADGSGKGDYIDIALFDSCLAWLANVGSAFMMTAELPQRMGNAHPSIVPYQAFRASDRHFIVAVGNDGQFGRLCQALSLPGLAEDQRFATNKQRVINRLALLEILEKLFSTRSAGHWIATLGAVSVPCGHINTLDQVFSDEQVRARGMQISAETHAGAVISMVGSPMKFASMPGPQTCSPPPSLGQHTDEVLAALLGLSPEERASLRAQGAI